MKRIIAALLVLIVLSTFIFIAGCINTEKDFVLKIQKEGELKILMLTDIHLTASEYETVEDLRAAGFNLGPVSGITAYQRDRWALQTVTELIEETEPDFIIVTGDMVYTNPFTQFLVPIGHTDNLLAMQMFAEHMESFGIPWAPVLGNHDHEGTTNREGIADYLTTLEHCVFEKGRDDIEGYGNYVVNVLNSDGTLNTSLIFMDSNSYRDPDDHTGFSGYASIQDNQVEWYENKLKAIKSKYKLQELPQSLLFCHIPVKEYETARQLYRSEQKTGISNPDFTFYEGVLNEIPCIPAIGEYDEVYYDGGNIFDKILELGSTKGIFVGHDHANNLIMEYLGILLVYGKSIDYIAYPAPDIAKKDNYRGGTLITLKDKSPFIYDGEDNKPVELISYNGGLYNAYIASKN